MRMRAVFWIIIGQLLLSGYMMYEKAQSAVFCVVGKSCDAVQQSAYGTLGGFDVRTLGFIAFALLLITHLTQHHHRYNKRLYLLGLVLGVVGATYYIGIQAFVLKQLCPTCMLIDGSMLVVAWLEYKAYRKGY